MDGLDVVQFVQKTLKGRKAQIQELMTDGGIKDMEHYRECMGEIRACDYVFSRGVRCLPAGGGQ